MQVATMVMNVYHQLHPFLGRKDLAMVIYALITSSLDYCHALYMQLEDLAQNAAALMLIGKNRFQHMTPLL